LSRRSEGAVKLLKELLFENKLTAVGLVGVIGFLVLALVEGVSLGRLTPYNPSAINLMEANLPPSPAHLFGTNFEGQDIFSRVLAAIPIDMGLPIIIVALSALIGLLLGSIAAYFRGVLDEAIARVTDVFLAFPGIIMALAVAATLGPSLINATLAILFVWWPPYVRLVRGRALEVVSQDFISASKALNTRFPYILWRGIIPNVLPSVLVYATMDVGTALLSLSTLGYLGLIPPTRPELGSMVASIGLNLYTYPWEALLPAFVVFLIVLCFSLLGDGLREMLDVKVRPHILIREKVEE
jgi:ABC-type dipeptide/oligopeptide/nickel transport systems, permease components